MGAAAIIGAAASVLGAGASVASGMKSLKKQKKLLDYQNEINNANYDKMLKDSRDYKAIVEAARRAGINPLVALGQSAGAGSVQGSSIPAESSLPGVIASAAGSVGSSISNLDLIGKQNKLLDEQIEAQSIQNEKDKLDLGDKGRQIEHQKVVDSLTEAIMQEQKISAQLDNYIKEGQKDAAISLLKNQASKTYEEIKLVQEQVKEGQINNETLSQMNKASYDLLVAQAKHYTDSYNLEIMKMALQNSQFKQSLSLEDKKRVDKWNTDLRDYYFKVDSENASNYLELFGDLYSSLSPEGQSSFAGVIADFASRNINNESNVAVWRNIAIRTGNPSAQNLPQSYSNSN